jgi:hypothetical protein
MFAHYQEAPEVSAQYHFGYKFSDFSAYGVTRKTFDVDHNLYGAIPILHANRITWHQHDKLLSACTKTTEIIDGTSYPVYLVNFTDLYQLKRQKIENKRPSGNRCGLGCGAPITSPPIIREDSLTETVRGIQAWRMTGWMEPINGPCGGNPYDWYWYDGIGDHVTPFTLLKNQICILVDENGLASFNNGNIFQIRSHIYFNFYDISHLNEDGEFLWNICHLEHQDFFDCTTYQYQMVLTLADKF